MLPDELDADLMRRFAESHAGLDDTQFTARVVENLGSARRRGFGAALRVFGTARSIVSAVLSGFATGITAPLRLRGAGLLALLAAAVTLWTGLQGL